MKNDYSVGHFPLKWSKVVRNRPGRPGERDCKETSQPGKPGSWHRNAGVPANRLISWPASHVIANLIFGIFPRCTEISAIK